MAEHCKKIVPLIILVVLCGSIVGLIFGLQNEADEHTGKEASRARGHVDLAATEAPPSESILGVFEAASVSADGAHCAQIGSDILQRNGTAIDAAIASLFCLGVVNGHSTGIGGGFLLTYYEKGSGKSYALDAREVAPGAAHADMFVDDPSLSHYGGLSVAVPGSAKGYWEAYQKFGGGLPWADLIEPTIVLCTEGFPVHPSMAKALANKQHLILDEPSMSVFLKPTTGKVLEEGDIFFNHDLVPTLRTLQEEPDALYSGSLSDAFIQDLANLGSIITKQDLTTYRVKWRDPIMIDLSNGDYRIHSFPPPGSGAIFAFIFNMLDNYNFTASSLNEKEIVTTYQRITEAFKYAYAMRTELGDPEYVDIKELVSNLTSEAYAYDIYSKITDDRTFQDPTHYGVKSTFSDLYGTSHLSVLAPNGDAVAVTGTINWQFGAVIRSEATGIILNNEMDDFSSRNTANGFGFPPSPSNFIKPGKRPLSSMSPSILVDSEGTVRLVIGASGGSHIITSTAWSSMHNLWFGKDIKESIDSRRLHHQLIPMVLAHEKGFRKDLILQLENIGHIAEEYDSRSVVCGISKEADGKIYANSDVRKGGTVDGF